MSLVLEIQGPGICSAMMRMVDAKICASAHGRYSTSGYFSSAFSSQHVTVTKIQGGSKKQAVIL